MPLPDFISRLRQTRVVQVVAVYVGASWAILEVTDLLTDALSLPQWVSPVVVILLLVGLVIVVATAWVQGRAAVPPQSGGDPPAVDVTGLRKALRGVSVPKLTWARTLTGGALAFGLVFAGAIAHAWLSDDAPRPLAADGGAAPGVAVLPFDVRGVEEGLWRDGLVDLMATNLDGVAGLRAIDSRTVLARWRENMDGSRGDLASSLDVARATGARFAVVGSALGVGPEVRVSARLYDLENREELGSGRVQGSPDSVLTLVDAISVELLRELLAGRDLGVPQRSLSRITTSSVPALRAFLRGEAATRRADFPAAIDAYQDALAEDSTFALAAHRLGTAYGWLETRGAEESSRYRKLAVRYSERLPSRDAALLRASTQVLDEGDPEGLHRLAELSTAFPDDPEVWNFLGEARWHLGPMVLVPRTRATEAFERAIQLDSTFAPAYIHPIEAAIGAGRDSARARRLLHAFGRVAAGGVREHTLRFAYDLVYHDPHTLPADLPDVALGTTAGTLVRGGYGTLPAFARLVRLTLEAGVVPPGLAPDALPAFRVTLDARRGRVDRVIGNNDAPGDARDHALAILVADYRLSLPDTLVQRALTFDSTATLFHIFDATRAAVRVGRERVVEQGKALLRTGRFAPPQGVQVPVTAEVGPVYARAIEGFARWQARDPDATARLEALREATIGYDTELLNSVIRTWLGGLHLEAGRPDRAITYLRSVVNEPMAGLRLAEAYEAAGHDRQAAEAYADMLRIWRDADDDFEPLLRARRGLERVRLQG